MQFEEFNKKIQDAAEQHHPPYDEQAWQKMEKLLKEHLPQQEKDRRRIIFFILFFLLLGGAVFIGINKPWQNKTAANGSAVTIHQDNKPQPDPKINTPQENAGSVAATEQDQKQQAGNKNEPGQETHLQQRSMTAIGHQNNLVAFDKHIQQNKVKKENGIVKENVSIDHMKQKTGNEPKKDEAISNNSVSRKDEAVVNNDKIAGNEKLQNSSIVPTDENKKDVVGNKTEEKSNTSSKQKNKTGRKNFLANITFSLSAGPDVSKAGNSQLGKTTLAYGAGISYTWRRLTLRTGIYSASKIYSADENDYKLNYNLPTNVKFEGADANCKVTEIPFSLSYHFAAKKDHSWFVGAGLSSYIMNREDYKYWYSNTGTGNYYSRDFEFKNKNKHYFSIIGLSAGYTRKLSNSISITAEPYLRIPTQGIGMGSVHLNSTGVLFSLGVQPFNNKKKK